MNALCRPALHRAQCACPDCHAGDPAVGCVPDPAGCVRAAAATTVAAPAASACSADADCPPALACAADGACRDPCDRLSCEPPKACAVRNHRPRCACKYGFALSELGELSCAPAERECRADADCAPHLRCTAAGRCRSPCDGDGGGPCAPDKKCLALDHRAVCVCADHCSPAAFMCLRDAGCAAHEACVNFACVDPCANVTCPAGHAPCAAEGHRAVCRFCPAGYSADSKSGCLKGN